MTREILEYRGHRILLDTFVEGGTMGWRFQIDGEQPVVQRTSSGRDELDALSEAKSAAISIIGLRSTPM